MMRLLAASCTVALAAASASSWAQTTCSNASIQLATNQTAQGIMRHPANYRGSIVSDPLTPGTWRLDFDDTGWPASGSSRRNYIKALYTYDATARVFRKTFPASAVGLSMTSAGATYVGRATVTFVAVDSNNNGVLNNGELNSQTISATYDVTCGTGTAACGGGGSLSGTGSLDAVTSPLSGTLATSPCVTAVEPSAWTRIKVLYRDR